MYRDHRRDKAAPKREVFRDHGEVDAVDDFLEEDLTIIDEVDNQQPEEPPAASSATMTTKGEGNAGNASVADHMSLSLSHNRLSPSGSAAEPVEKRGNTVDTPVPESAILSPKSRSGGRQPDPDDQKNFIQKEHVKQKQRDEEKVLSMSLPRYNWLEQKINRILTEEKGFSLPDVTGASFEGDDSEEGYILNTSTGSFSPTRMEPSPAKPVSFSKAQESFRYQIEALLDTSQLNVSHQQAVHGHPVTYTRSHYMPANNPPSAGGIQHSPGSAFRRPAHHRASSAKSIPPPPPYNNLFM